MAYDFCKLTMLGRLVADPRRGEAAGKTVLNCRMAATVGFGDKESSTFVSFAIWDKLAEAMADKLSKGSRVLVHGDLSTREYETKGEKRTDLEFRFVDSFTLCDSAPGGGRKDWPDQKPDDFDPPRGRTGERSGFPGRR